LSANQRRDEERLLAEVLRPLVTRAKCVGGYAAVGSEIDATHALGMAKKVALPHFVHRSSIFTFRAGPPVDVGPHHIPQPDADAPLVTPDLVLVPLLLADRQGGRLGQGAGHYDRVLPSLVEAGALFIGVGWPFQLGKDELPREEHDVLLHGFASPEGLEMFA
jgi:5-formyltetrahydrofolate cyclo-ligase